MSVSLRLCVLYVPHLGPLQWGLAPSLVVVVAVAGAIVVGVEPMPSQLRVVLP